MVRYIIILVRFLKIWQMAKLNICHLWVKLKTWIRYWQVFGSAPYNKKIRFFFCILMNKMTRRASNEVFYKLFIIVCCVICVLPLLRRAAADSAIQYFNSQTERAYTHWHCLCNFQTLSIVQKNMNFIPCCNSAANINTNVHKIEVE